MPTGKGHHITRSTLWIKDTSLLRTLQHGCGIHNSEVLLYSPTKTSTIPNKYLKFLGNQYYYSQKNFIGYCIIINCTSIKFKLHTIWGTCACMYTVVRRYACVCACVCLCVCVCVHKYGVSERQEMQLQVHMDHITHWALIHPLHHHKIPVIPYSLRRSYSSLANVHRECFQDEHANSASKHIQDQLLDSLVISLFFVSL